MLAARFSIALVLIWAYIFKRKLAFNLNKDEYSFVALLSIVYLIGILFALLGGVL